MTIDVSDLESATHAAVELSFWSNQILLAIHPEEKSDDFPDLFDLTMDLLVENFESHEKAINKASSFLCLTSDIAEVAGISGPNCHAAVRNLASRIFHTTRNAVMNSTFACAEVKNGGKVIDDPRDAGGPGWHERIPIHFKQVYRALRAIPTFNERAVNAQIVNDHARAMANLRERQPQPVAINKAEETPEIKKSKKRKKPAGRPVPREDRAQRILVSKRWIYFKENYRDLGYRRASKELFIQWAVDKYDDMPTDDPVEIKKMLEAYRKTN